MTSRRSRTFAPVDPLTLLDLANDLAGGTNPASFRSAGDRAYYAAFLNIRDQLARRNLAQFRSDGSAHRQVRQSLLNLDNNMGRLLDDLRIARNALTYETRAVTLPKGRTLTWMLETARTLIEFVNTLPEPA